MSTLWNTPASAIPLFLSEVKIPEDLYEQASELALKLANELEKQQKAYRISRQFIDWNQILP